MMAAAHYLALDLGASGGRALLGAFDGACLRVDEVHRFANGPVTIGGRLYWDAFRLLSEVKQAIGQCTQRGVKLDGIGIDTWGVDFALLARGGELLSMPRHYRDPRTRGVMEQVFARIPRSEIYRRTGIQFMPLNTLYQLYAAVHDNSRLLDIADRLLFMPDLLAYWLCGAAQTERSIASTSQMLSAQTNRWDRELLAAAGVPPEIMPPVRDTATIAGTLLPKLVAEIGQAGTPVIHTASHDTASAVAAVPATSRSWAYISSGTWSLIGMELPQPLINDDALAANFTNEAGVAGTTRFLHNVTGLWLVQECQRTWTSQGQTCTHEELTQLARQAPARRSLINPDDPRFAEPGDMPARIRAACAETGQPVPEAPGAVVRCALDSLAHKACDVLGTLERLTGCAIETLHLVGGGVRNELLNQLTANATGRRVVTGPIEATAVGNILVQAMAQGRVGSLYELREVVAASTELRTYEPQA